jgi:hypothetical protein
LRETYPTYAILGEEGTHYAFESNSLPEYTWVIDPIDGTSAYAGRLTGWCVGVGLLARGVPIAGVVYSPMNNECYVATPEGHAYRNNVLLTAVNATSQIRHTVPWAGPHDRGYHSFALLHCCQHGISSSCRRVQSMGHRPRTRTVALHRLRALGSQWYCHRHCITAQPNCNQPYHALRTPRRVRPLPSIHPRALCTITLDTTYVQRFTCESQRGASSETATQVCSIPRTTSSNAERRRLRSPRVKRSARALRQSLAHTKNNNAVLRALRSQSTLTPEPKQKALCSLSRGLCTRSD